MTAATWMRVSTLAMTKLPERAAAVVRVARRVKSVRRGSARSSRSAPRSCSGPEALGLSAPATKDDDLARVGLRRARTLTSDLQRHFSRGVGIETEDVCR